MKSNTLLLIAGLASAFYAVFLIAAPGTFTELHGITTDDYGLLFIRSTGALSVGYMILGFGGSRLKSEDGLKLAVLSNFGAWLTMFCVMLFAMTTLKFNSFIYMDLGFCALFSILFGIKAITK